MDCTCLATQLNAGRSIESLARETGLSPSTVAYWVKKHGLSATHASKHAAKGGIEAETLSALVERGLSVRQIAAELGCSYATVQHWLKNHQLRTVRGERLAETRVARAEAPDKVTATCSRHGVTTFVRKLDGGFHCLKCRAEAVVRRRRRVKLALIADFGSRCGLCGYDRSPAALQFHHVDPATKSFSIAERGVARSLEAAREEAGKCVLLCANCHAEVEAGVATLALLPPGQG